MHGRTQIRKYIRTVHPQASSKRAHRLLIVRRFYAIWIVVYDQWRAIVVVVVVCIRVIAIHHEIFTHIMLTSIIRCDFVLNKQCF